MPNLLKKKKKTIHGKAKARVDACLDLNAIINSQCLRVSFNLFSGTSELTFTPYFRSQIFFLISIRQPLKRIVHVTCSEYWRDELCNNKSWVINNEKKKGVRDGLPLTSPKYNFWCTIVLFYKHHSKLTVLIL